MHEKGTSFYARTSEIGIKPETYHVIYFATNREVHFEGELTGEQIQKLTEDSTRVKSIQIDEFAGEITVQE